MGGNHSKSPKQTTKQQKPFSNIATSSSPSSPPAETHDNDQEVIPQTESNLGASPPTSPETVMPEPDLLGVPPLPQRVSDLSSKGENSEQRTADHDSVSSVLSVAEEKSNGSGDDKNSQDTASAEPQNNGPAEENKEHSEQRTDQKKKKKEKPPKNKPAKREDELRPYEEELKFLKKESDVSWTIDVGFVENMRVGGIFFVNEKLKELTFGELQESKQPDGIPGGFIPALKQIANVAALPGIVKYSIGLPDVHSGYGFAIGNTAAFDMDDPEAIVSPGGVGFDINCGVRLIRTNLMVDEVEPLKEELAQALFDFIPVGVGAKGTIPMTADEINAAIEQGVDWCITKGIAWPEDRDHCEEHGRMPNADATKVSERAKMRGLPQLGTLGAGNHYGEVQVIDEIFDPVAAEAMGINKLGQIVLMVHCGSRGLGHQVATDALLDMEKVMARDGIVVNDRQLACAKIHSKEGRDYLAGMAAAANFAWVNRSAITHTARQAFSKVFKKEPRDMDMHVVYDVSHNIAKEEKHIVDGVERNLLVHRKGSTRAFPPGDPRIPEDYQGIGQPVLIGGTMGTCSYVLTGTHKGMATTFGSTCHGAGRVKSRAKSRRELNSTEIQKKLAADGICVKVASPKLIMEEAPESYKDVVQVIETCAEADISKKTVRLRPIAVIKG